MAAPALSVAPGESVRLRFRGEVAGGKLARPPEARVRVRVFVPDGSRLLDTVEADWTGREWQVTVDTSHWAPGTYTATAEVSGPDGAGAESASFEIRDPEQG